MSVSAHVRKIALGCLIWALAAASSADAAADRPLAPTATTEEEVRAAVVRYFEVWSNADMRAYRRSFHSSAVIHHRDARGRVRQMMLDAFIAGQRAAHASVPGMVEVPISIEISHDAHAAQAKVHWRLVANEEVSCGEDHFQFVRVGANWKITSLLFYGSPCRAP